MKLKTLEDMSYGLNHIPNSHVVPKELRQEAINDIKEIKKSIIYPYGKDIPILDSENKLAKFAGAIEYIKWKNNLTEKDLK